MRKDSVIAHFISLRCSLGRSEVGTEAQSDRRFNEELLITLVKLAENSSSTIEHAESISLTASSLPWHVCVRTGKWGAYRTFTVARQERRCSLGGGGLMNKTAQHLKTNYLHKPIKISLSLLLSGVDDAVVTAAIADADAVVVVVIRVMSTVIYSPLCKEAPMFKILQMEKQPYRIRRNEMGDTGGPTALL